MSDDPIRAADVFGPGKRSAGLIYGAVGMLPAAVFAYFAWIPFSIWREHGDTTALPVAVALLVVALVFVAISVVVICMSRTLVVVKLTDTGLVIETDGVFAQPPLALLWADLDRIDLCPMHRGVQRIILRPARNTGRTPRRLLNYQLGVPLLMIVQGIAARAGDAGYQLERVSVFQIHVCRFAVM